RVFKPSLPKGRFAKPSYIYNRKAPPPLAPACTLLRRKKRLHYIFMSIVQASMTWLRQTVGWSNSRQSWEERIGVSILLLGIVGLRWYGAGLTAVQQVLLWGFFILAAAILLRRGWLKLFGPVLFYDMVTSARRARYFALRGSYAGLLLLF